jgi:hypothetical protein
MASSASTGPGPGLPPRSPGPRCLSCSHPDRDRLDALVVAAERTFDSLSEEFGIAASSIHRHAKVCLPVRLVQTRAAPLDEGFRELLITASANRLRRIQARAIQLEEVRSDRAAAADPAVPGDRTGLLVKRYRSIRTGPKEWREVIDAELDTGLLAEERALEEAAAKETGEWLAQHGRGAFGVDGSSGRGPLVVVLSSGLQPLPGPAPGAARHRITDPRRLRPATAAEAEAAGAIPLSLVDVEQQPDYVVAVEDTRERALSGVVEGLDLDEVADLDDVDASS